MRHLTISLCMVLSAATCLGWPQMLTKPQTPQPVKIKMTRITPHPVDAGKEMYNSYCASCHGEDGKGYGPAAPGLKTKTPDLTMLAAHNNGRYPKLKVITALSKFSETHQTGTTSEMPDWYTAFVSLDRATPIKADMRARSISKHIQTLQVVR